MPYVGSYRAKTKAQFVIYRLPNGSFKLNIKSPPVENLVFEGGGVCGLAYAGTIAALYEQSKIIEHSKRVAGSSAGAITALAIGLGYDPNVVQKIIAKLDFNDLVDVDVKAKATMASRLATQGYIDSGEKLLSFIRELIKTRVEKALQDHADKLAKYNINPNKVTFNDLANIARELPNSGFKELFITVTEIDKKTNKARLQVLCASNPRFADTEVALAVRASASIPKFFKPVTLETEPGKTYIDGGCLNNYPIDLFDFPAYAPTLPYVYQGVFGQNLCSLGFKIDTSEEMTALLWQAKDKNTVLDFIQGRMMNIVTGVKTAEAEREKAQSTYEKYSHRTCQIPNQGIGMVEFNISEARKHVLFNSGFNATKNWIEHYHQSPMVLDEQYSSLPELLIKMELPHLEKLANFLRVSDQPVFFDDPGRGKPQPITGNNLTKLKEEIFKVLNARLRLESEGHNTRFFNQVQMTPCPLLDEFIREVTPALQREDWEAMLNCLTRKISEKQDTFIKEQEHWTTLTLAKAFQPLLVNASAEWKVNMGISGEKLSDLIEHIELAKKVPLHQPKRKRIE